MLSAGLANGKTLSAAGESQIWVGEKGGEAGRELHYRSVGGWEMRIPGFLTLLLLTLIFWHVMIVCSQLALSN